jgi:uncharacterized membrane protein YfcA
LDIITAILIFLLAFCYEVIDASLGQGYGTLGSPTLILLGFDPKLVVPVILISQAGGGLTGAFWQNHYKNVDFSNSKTADMRKVYFIVACGIVGVVVASFIGFKISKDMLTTYIGLVVLTMGILIVSGVVLKFTWKKLSVIGAVSAFNKGMSGGGYGPVVAGGQVIIGVGAKSSVGITDFAEAPICIAGFITWTLLAQAFPPLDFMFAMILGCATAPALGAWLTFKIPAGKLKRIMGVVIIILGILCLLKVLNP